MFCDSSQVFRTTAFTICAFILSTTILILLNVNPANSNNARWNFDSTNFFHNFQKKRFQEAQVPFADRFPDKTFVNEIAALAESITFVDRNAPDVSGVLPDGFIADEDHSWIDMATTQAIVVIKAANTDGTTTTNLDNDDETSTTTPFVVFRGTKESEDWGTNLNLRLVSWNDVQGIPEDVKVHNGFLGGVMDDGIIEQLEKNIMEMSQVWDEIYVTGHSLGGALSQVFSAYMAHKYPEKKVTMVTFGQPRIGNEEFKTWTEMGLTSNLQQWRFVLDNDAVPRKFWRTIGFFHSGHLIHLEPDDPKATAYYRQSGDTELGFDGVPGRWNYFAYSSRDHYMANYRLHLKGFLDSEDDFPTYFAQTLDDDSICRWWFFGSCE